MPCLSQKWFLIPDQPSECSFWTSASVWELFFCCWNKGQVWHYPPAPNRPLNCISVKDDIWDNIILRHIALCLFLFSSPSIVFAPASLLYFIFHIKLPVGFSFSSACLLFFQGLKDSSKNTPVEFEPLVVPLRSWFLRSVSWDIYCNKSRLQRNLLAPETWQLLIMLCLNICTDLFRASSTIQR